MTLFDLQNLTLENDKKNEKSKESAVFIKQLYDESSKSFLKQHRDWYINERYARGDHWIMYNKTLNKIQSLPVSDGEIRRTVNKIKAQMRGVKNFIKKYQPRWEVHPDDITDAAYEEASKKNKILQYIYRTRQFPLHLTDLINNGLKFSQGILEGAVVKKEGKDYLDFWIDDTFDIIFDPVATSIQNCRFIIKTVKKPITYIERRYKVKNITADNKEAAASYKEMLEMEKYTRGGSKGCKDLETAILYQIYLKYSEEDKIKIKIITSTDKQILETQNPNYRRYPFFGYAPERCANSIYNDAWIKDLISLNKSLDKTTSQIEAYIQRMLAGKWLIKQGVDVTSITDKGAEKIYYKGSTPPMQANLPPLPSAPFTHASNTERYIEELGGQREASLGRIPGSLQSGKAIESLQAADAMTVSEPVENLEKMLEEVGEFTLEVINDYQITSEEIVEEGEKIRYIGGGAKNLPDETMVVKPSQVKVVIVPEIAYTEDAKLERLMQLLESGIIDPQTVLEKLHVSNISEVLDRVKKVKEEEYKQEMMKQKESHRTEGEGPEDSASLADQENMQMSAGQTPPLTPQALWVPEHTQLHIAFIQQNKDAYNQNQQVFDEHISAEQQFIQ